MKIALTVIFIALISNLFAQTNVTLGVGVVTVKIEALPTLSFYIDTLSRRPAKTVSIVKDEHQEFAIRNRNMHAWLAPEGLWLDYYIFTFRCTKKVGSWCQVYVSNSDKTKYWIRLNKNLLYLNWDKYLNTQATWIGKKTEFSLQVKQFPSESSRTIKMMEKEDCFTVLEVKGDWMKIKTSEILDCSSSKHPVKSGWIKWRMDNKLLIDYGLSC